MFAMRSVSAEILTAIPIRKTTESLGEWHRTDQRIRALLSKQWSLPPWELDSAIARGLVSWPQVELAVELAMVDFPEWPEWVEWFIAPELCRQKKMTAEERKVRQAELANMRRLVARFGIPKNDTQRAAREKFLARIEAAEAALG